MVPVRASGRGPRRPDPGRLGTMATAVNFIVMVTLGAVLQASVAGKFGGALQ